MEVLLISLFIIFKGQNCFMNMLYEETILGKNYYIYQTLLSKATYNCIQVIHFH